MTGDPSNWYLPDPYVPAAAGSWSYVAFWSPESEYGGAGLWLAAPVARLDYADTPWCDAGPSA